MSVDNFDIEDILLEARKIREKADAENRRIDTDYASGIFDEDLENAIHLANTLKESGVIEKVERDRNYPQEGGSFRQNDSFKVEIKLDEAEQLAVSNKFKANVDGTVMQKEVQRERPINPPIRPIPIPGKPQQEKSPQEFQYEPYSFPVKTQREKPAPKGFVKNKKAGEKVDIFNFQPEQRKKPFTAGQFGEKHLDFGTPSQATPPPQSFGQGYAKTTNPELVDSRDFDFEAVSQKIEEIHRIETELKHTSPIAKPNMEDEKARIRNRYNKLIFKNQDGQPMSSQEGYSGNAGLGGTMNGMPKVKKSIFSTFATGTGRELNIEDIRKIDFSNVEGAGGHYDDEDEVSYADRLPDGQAINLQEFGPKSNRRDVARDIARTRKGIFVRTAIIAVVTFMLFYLGYSTKNIKVPLPPFIFPTGKELNTFLLFNIGLMLLLVVTCLNTVISGVVGLFRMRANSDTLVSFALFATIFQGIFSVITIESFVPETMTLFFPIAALTLLFNYIGKLSMLGRIQQNFKLAAGKRERLGAGVVESPSYCREVLPRITDSQPTIAYSAKANFFADFLGLSFSTKYDVGMNRGIAPVSIIGAIIVGIATRFLSGSSFMAASAFAAVLCICTTLSSTFIENIPLTKMSRKLVPMSAMVSGNKAVETFCDTKAVVLRDSDLFPKGHVYLNGIKAFPNARIDEAILDAASVLCALKGSLGEVFLDVIGGDKKLLKKVDNVVYENNMGLSGWVDGRRVLIGNRMLMQNHGVRLPNDSYERDNPRETPGNPLYLSNSGEVSARFLVEYKIDEPLAYQLDLWAAKEKELIVYTNDANVDAELIWQLYSYPADLITILPSELQEPMREMMDDRDEMPAEIVYTGKAASLIAAILATINARTSILIGTIIQFLQIVLGYGIVAVMSFMGTVDTFALSKLVGFQLFWFVITFIAQQIRKP